LLDIGGWLDQAKDAPAQSKSSTELLSLCSTQPHMKGLFAQVFMMDVSNIVPRRGDAQALPHPDDHFDSAYLVATLGEVPDKGRALRELRRVLKRGGRLVVGEVLLDPHKVTFEELRRLTDAGGLDHERTLKGTLGYFAAFRAT
jgi:SAM-dependent methyltransferase